MLPAQPLAGPITAPSAVLIADCRLCRPGTTASLPIHPRLFGVARRKASIACRSLLPAPFPDQGSFSSTSITRLHRYYDPIRHSRGPVPCLTTPPLASTACQPPQGASRVAHNPSFAHAVATTPAEPLGACVVRFPTAAAFPEIQAGRLPHCPFEACSAFTARYGLCARQVPTDPLHQKLRPVRYLHGRSDCYRLERHLPGGVSHPLRLCTFARRTE